MAKLAPLAEVNPHMKVLTGHSSDPTWFDEVESVETCRINRHEDILECCGPHEIDEEGSEEVLVIT